VDEGASRQLIFVDGLFVLQDNLVFPGETFSAYHQAWPYYCITIVRCTPSHSGVLFFSEMKKAVKSHENPEVTPFFNR
jgi:hypothetical protein